MKRCDYCGRENQDAAAYCRECGGQEFNDPGKKSQEEAQQSEADEPAQSELADTPTKCGWCGRQNPPGTINCHECGTPLERPKDQLVSPAKVAASQRARWTFRTLTPDEEKLDLVTLLTCQSVVEADVVVAQLESIGISAFIPDEFVAQAMAWNANAFGFVRVQVSPKDYERAKDFLFELSQNSEPNTAANGGLPGASPESDDEEGPPSLS